MSNKNFVAQIFLVVSALSVMYLSYLGKISVVLEFIGILLCFLLFFYLEHSIYSNGRHAEIGRKGKTLWFLLTMSLLFLSFFIPDCDLPLFRFVLFSKRYPVLLVFVVPVLIYQKYLFSKVKEE